MNSVFAPHLILKTANDKSILWFATSNQYIVISTAVLNILETYLGSKSQDEFLKVVQGEHDIQREAGEVLYEEITAFLLSANQPKVPEIINHQPPPIPSQGIEEVYAFGKFSFRVIFGSHDIIELIAPQWRHALSTEVQSFTNNYNIFKKNNNLYFFKNKNFIQEYAIKDYHLLQGQFALQMINILYQKSESDWIATFHASTVANGKEAIMLIGDSGNGKSTLSAVLMAHGFDVVADDFTPLAVGNKEVYRFPSGISVKKGAFDLMETLYPDFENYPLYQSTSKNVTIKYIPPSEDFNLARQHFPCSKIVYVKFEPQSYCELKPVATETILSTLIPDSWLSPEAANAKLFLEWLKDVEGYELRYNDNAEAVSKFEELFGS